MRVALLTLCAVTGCAAIRVRPAEGPNPADAWRASAVSCSQLSPRTRQTLRRYDLERDHVARLDQVAEKLHEEALADPRPDLLYALAEVHYLRGQLAEKARRPDACACYYLAAGYAYHYLFDAAPAAAPEIRRVDHTGELPRPALPREAFDPRFRLACELYNAGLAKCIAAAQKAGQLDPRRCLVLPTRDGRSAIRLAVVHTGFTYRPEEFGELRLCADWEVIGLANHHRTYGLGVPLIGCRAADAPRPAGAFYPPNVSFPVTAFFRFRGSLADLAERRSGRLELVNPLAQQNVVARGRAVPLESDLTTPLAFFLARARLDNDGYLGFLRPDALGAKAGLHALEPYQPGKVPVVLVHGLLGSPLTWAPLYNDLLADPVIRRRFQFWVYFYPTANAYLTTAADLRGRLTDLRQRLDPGGTDVALDEMVLVGHSMGGLVSRLLTVDGGDDFWNLVTPASFDSLNLRPQTREELRNTFYFRRLPFVTRAVFLGTPHRGSSVSPSPLGRLGARLAGIPRQLMRTAQDILEDNPDLSASFRARPLPSSIDLLDPQAPVLQLIADRPRPAAVRYHSVVGVITSNALLVERLFAGGLRQAGDGVVPYASAHLADASELVVPADHSTVHHHPLAILEVRRILLEHLREFDERRRPIRRAGGVPEGP